ncbi:hypothetical protein FA95DRAFT_1311826 [Auriscalpium vulgare]|uniref:Uncharacterized protein n=1 Tax=Auriscalpium vulgare TaxID=40419 RepID=A0ACB8RS61_9AGAM|nr:hypothetical protein FA95DRAFT_1311826 [Auriscalpium vulgare]
MFLCTSIRSASSEPQFSSRRCRLRDSDAGPMACKTCQRRFHDCTATVRCHAVIRTERDGRMLMTVLMPVGRLKSTKTRPGSRATVRSDIEYDILDRTIGLYVLIGSSDGVP